MPVSTLGSSGMVNPGIKDGAIDGPRSALQEKTHSNQYYRFSMNWKSRLCSAVIPGSLVYNYFSEYTVQDKRNLHTVQYVRLYICPHNAYMKTMIITSFSRMITIPFFTQSIVERSSKVETQCLRVL